MVYVYTTVLTVFTTVFTVLGLYMIKCTSPYLVKLFIYLALIASMELHKGAVHAGPVATKTLVLYDKQPNLIPVNTEPTNTLGSLNYFDLEKILGSV